jgi:putative ABC transport system substrate-binding protein
MRRREFVTLLTGAAAAWPLAARAQQPAMPVVGFLMPAGGIETLVGSVGGSAFVQALNERGYYEGRNFKFEFRSAENQHDRLPGLARELVQRRVDVIFANGPAAPAAKAATSTIPIVFEVGADPVELVLCPTLPDPVAT